MTEQDPYQSPDAPIASPPESRGLAVGLLAFVGLQIAFSAFAMPAALSLANQRDITPISVLTAILAVLFLTIAGVFVLAKGRAAVYFFGVSAFLSGAVLLQWRPAHVVTCLAIALIGCFVSTRHSKARPKV